MSEMVFDQTKNPNNFFSQNFLLVPTHSDQFLFIISGNVIIDYRSVSPQWRRDTLHLKINIPPWLNQFSAGGSSLKVAEDGYTPWITAHPVSNEDGEGQVGWSVDGFSVEEQRASDQSFEICNQANLKADIAVRDENAKGFVLRIGYHCTYLGKFVHSKTN